MKVIIISGTPGTGKTTVARFIEKKLGFKRIDTNEIIDKQFVDTVIVVDYHHQHIFRDLLTDAKSDFLASSAKKGDVYIKVINYTVPNDWNVDNMEILSYVHEKDAKWDVIQTAIKSVK